MHDVVADQVRVDLGDLCDQPADARFDNRRADERRSQKATVEKRRECPRAARAPAGDLRVKTVIGS
jgi:hypothetical protein